MEEGEEEEREGPCLLPPVIEEEVGGAKESLLTPFAHQSDRDGAALDLEGCDLSCFFD